MTTAEIHSQFTVMEGMGNQLLIRRRETQELYLTRLIKPNNYAEPVPLKKIQELHDNARKN